MILKPHANVLLNHTSETDGAIELYARRVDVDRVNNENIARIRSAARSYKCIDHFRWSENHKDDRTMERNTFRMPDGTLASLVSRCSYSPTTPLDVCCRKIIASKHRYN